MLKTAIQAVAQFHAAKNVDFTADLGKLSSRNDMPQLLVTMQQHADYCTRWLNTDHGELGPESGEFIRMLRLQLIIEECCELIAAILSGDEIETLDAMADLIYVTLGSAVAFDLPLSGVFDEVCNSNMTKAPPKGNDPRIRDKGDTYRPPNIAQILNEYREETRRRGNYEST